MKQIGTPRQLTFSVILEKMHAGGGTLQDTERREGLEQGLQFSTTCFGDGRTFKIMCRDWAPMVEALYEADTQIVYISKDSSLCSSLVIFCFPRNEAI